MNIRNSNDGCHYASCARRDAEGGILLCFAVGLLIRYGLPALADAINKYFPPRYYDRTLTQSVVCVSVFGALGLAVGNCVATLWAHALHHHGPPLRNEHFVILAVSLTGAFVGALPGLTYWLHPAYAALLDGFRNGFRRLDLSELLASSPAFQLSYGAAISFPPIYMLQRALHHNVYFVHWLKLHNIGDALGYDLLIVVATTMIGLGMTYLLTGLHDARIY